LQCNQLKQLPKVTSEFSILNFPVTCFGFDSSRADNRRTVRPMPLPPKSKSLLMYPECKLEMRLMGIEPKEPSRDLFTFECTKCKRMEVRSVRLK
jgi:hypothetical protein